MGALEFITGHMVYNPAYNLILQLKATNNPITDSITAMAFEDHLGSSPFTIKNNKEGGIIFKN